MAVVEVIIIQDAFCTCRSPGLVSVLAALAAGSLDDPVTRTCPVKVTRGTATTATAARTTSTDVAGCAAEAATAAATAAGCTIVVTPVIV